MAGQGTVVADYFSSQLLPKQIYVWTLGEPPVLPWIPLSRESERLSSLKLYPSLSGPGEGEKLIETRLFCAFDQPVKFVAASAQLQGLICPRC